MPALSRLVAFIALIGLGLLVFGLATPASADLFEWEFIDPNDSSLGKQQSTTLVADGSGVVIEPAGNYGSFFSPARWQKAYLIDSDLEGSTVTADLSGADLSRANLHGVQFSQRAVYHGANFTDATISGVRLDRATDGGFTEAQLYSTASYKQGELPAITMNVNQLDNWSFASQNLTSSNFFASSLGGADFSSATLERVRFHSAVLAHADFTGATIRGAIFSQTVNKGFSSQQLYSTASYQSGDLSDIDLGSNILTGWNFSSQNLSNAKLRGATVASADFTGAEIRGADFFGNSQPQGSGTLSAQQLYSTASYGRGDLTGVGLSYSDLSGWSFAGQDLSDASLDGSLLTGANFAGATIRGVNLNRTGITFHQIASTASYARRDLQRVHFYEQDFSEQDLAGQNLSDSSLVQSNLAEANLRGANLSRASFTSTDVTGTDFTGAIIQGASFARSTGFTQAQLLSTESYAEGDLSRISLNDLDIEGWNLSGLSLMRANLSLGRGFSTNVVGVDLSRSDLRGATIGPLDGSILHNTVLPDGSLVDLDLTSGDVIVIREMGTDLAFNAMLPNPIAITVSEGLKMTAGAELDLRFQAFDWGSTIQFEAGIPVEIDGGTLSLRFTPETDLLEQVGRSIDLFDWTGVDPTGEFVVSSLLEWDLSNLYSTGEVTLLSVPASVGGDFNGDGVLNGLDRSVWQDTYGLMVAPGSGADGNLDGVIDAADYTIWRDAAAALPSSVPEPATILIALISCIVPINRRVQQIAA